MFMLRSDGKEFQSSPTMGKLVKRIMQMKTTLPLVPFKQPADPFGIGQGWPEFRG